MNLITFVEVAELEHIITLKNEKEWEILKTKISEEEKLKINEIDQEKIILELKH